MVFDSKFDHSHIRASEKDKHTYLREYIEK